MTRAPRVLACMIALLPLITTVSTGTGAEGAQSAFEWRDGDLLFLDLPCPLCEALESASLRQIGAHGPRLAHVALIARDAGAWVAYEALPGVGVVRTPLPDVLSRSEPFGTVQNFHVARLKGEYQGLVPAAVKAAQRRLGTPFDHDYRRNDGRLTSGELIVEVLQAAGSRRNPFRYQALYFGEPGVADPDYEAWRVDFESRGLAVPTGQAGVFPLRLYMADSVERLR